MVWVRYADSVCQGKVINSQPEMNMYAVQSVDNKSLIVVRGIEDIIPIQTDLCSPTVPPATDEWDDDFEADSCFSPCSPISTISDESIMPKLPINSSLFITTSSQEYSSLPLASHSTILTTSPSSFVSSSCCDVDNENPSHSPSHIAINSSSIQYDNLITESAPALNDPNNSLQIQPTPPNDFGTVFSDQNLLSGDLISQLKKFISTDSEASMLLRDQLLTLLSPLLEGQQSTTNHLASDCNDNTRASLLSRLLQSNLTPSGHHQTFDWPSESLPVGEFDLIPQVPPSHPGTTTISNIGREPLINYFSPYSTSLPPTQPTSCGLIKQSSATGGQVIGKQKAPVNKGHFVRSDVKKCRKVYGIAQRHLWCNQCKWKKACRRFPDPKPPPIATIPASS